MIRTTFSAPNIPETGILALPFYENGQMPEIVERFNKDNGDILSKFLRKSKFKGKLGQTALLGTLSNKRLDMVILYGLGKAEKLSQDDLQAVGGHIYSAVKPLNCRTLSILTDREFSAPILKNWQASALIAFGFNLAAYSFKIYKTSPDKQKDFAIQHLKILSAGNGRAEKFFKTLEIYEEGITLARDLLNYPANVLNPATFSNYLKDLPSYGIDIKEVSKHQMEELGMNCFLAVGAGSAVPPRLLLLSYKGDPENEEGFPLALVGKGLTFDSGGISIKPSLGMGAMKMDMGGAAVVCGTLLALAKQKVPLNVLGAIGLAENMPDGAAARPGDVVKSMNGLTVEIDNTDAEGRLVLADVLTYVQKHYHPKTIIDFATLTGACIIALGHEHGGLFSNNGKLAKNLLTAGQSSGEKLWQLPLHSNYDKMIDSNIADIINTSRVSGAGAGTITAAQFLHRFIEKKVNWAHIDIAGVAMGYKREDHPCYPSSGGSGFGVLLMCTLLQQYGNNPAR